MLGRAIFRGACEPWLPSASGLLTAGSAAPVLVLFRCQLARAVYALFAWSIRLEICPLVFACTAGAAVGVADFPSRVEVHVWRVACNLSNLPYHRVEVHLRYR